MALLSFDNESKNIRQFIIENLIRMLDKTNNLVKIFRTIRDRYQQDEIPSMKLRLIEQRNTDSNQYNLPTSNDIAALIVGDIGEHEQGRDIIIQDRTDSLQRITKLHPCYMALQYPLLFPYGEDGYTINLKYNINNLSNKYKRKKISMREFYCYQLQERRTQGNTLFRGGRLFQQYIVDAYASVEEDRLDYIRKNQKNLRSEIYQGIQDAITRGDTNAQAIGKRIILPSSHTGSPRYMIQNYQDAMAICRRYGNPDLFITFTCNPKWPEITRALARIPGQKPEDRPDIITRIFKMKLDSLLSTIKNKNIF